MNNIFSHNCEHTEIYRLAVGVFNAYLRSLGGNCPRLRVSTNNSGTDCHCTRSSHFHGGGALPRSLNDSFSSSRPPPISLFQTLQAFHVHLPFAGMDLFTIQLPFSS
jgi:hypothetical protein